MLCPPRAQQCSEANTARDADNEKQLQEKMQAFQDLQSNLEHEDLLQAVEMKKCYGAIVPYARAIYQQGQRLSRVENEYCRV